MQTACSEHFRREEALLAREGFRSLAAHRDERHRVEAEIAGLVARLGEETPPARPAEAQEAVLAFRILLLEQLLYYDLAYKSYLQNRHGRCRRPGLAPGGRERDARVVFDFGCSEYDHRGRRRRCPAPRL